MYLFKVNRRNTRKRCEICSKLTIKTPERRQWQWFYFFYHWLWTGKCLLGCPSFWIKQSRKETWMCEICSKLPIKRLQWSHWRRLGNFWRNVTHFHPEQDKISEFHLHPEYVGEIIHNLSYCPITQTNSKTKIVTLQCVELVQFKKLNPLSDNSNTLKQFVGSLPNCFSVWPFCRTGA